MNNSKMLTHMTRAALEDYLKQNDPVVLIPLGSIEQHGPHLPLGTDILSAIKICEAVAQKTDSLIAPLCWVGYSEHHMGFKGTITLKQETLLNVLLDGIESLARHGLKKILIVNFHGGNDQTVEYAIREAKTRFGVKITSMKNVSKDPFDASAKTLEDFDIHAGKFETSFVLNTLPELVELERVKDWKPTVEFPEEIKKLRKLKDEETDSPLLLQLAMLYIPETHKLTSSGIYGLPNPMEATAREGKEILDDIVARLVKLINLWNQL